MSTNSKIEWTDETWNPVVGCTKVSPGCTNCYAIRLANRIAGAPGQEVYRELTARRGAGSLNWTGVVRCLPERLELPLHWRRPRRVFVNSMSDLFHVGVPDDFLAAVFGVMALTPHHTYQVLTKRPDRMAAFFADVGLTECAEGLTAYVPWWEVHVPTAWSGWPLPNVWLGVSVEDQAAADARIPLLLQTPAAVRFLSCEPLLGPVDLSPWLDNISDLPDLPGDWCPPPRHGRWYQINEFDQPIHWVICGGESGPNARPMHPDWARSLRDQCQAAAVPFFFKQWGEFAPLVGGLSTSDGARRAWAGNRRVFPVPPYGRGAQVFRVGRKAAGRVLDGRTWDEFPEVTKGEPCCA